MKLKPNQITLICLVLLATSYMLLAIFRWWLADAAFANAKKLTDAGYVSQALPDFNKAIRLLPAEPLFHDSLADTAAKIAVVLSQQAATDSARQFQDLALAESALALKLSPVNLNFHKTRIRVLFFLAQIDPDFYPQTLGALRQAISLAPTDAKLRYNLGILEQELGQTATAKLTLQKSLELKPDYAAARQALEQLGDVDR